MQYAICGHQGVAGAAFCQDCGQRLIQESPAATEPVPQQSDRSVPWGPGRIVLGIFLALLLLFVAAGAAAGIAWLYSSQEVAVATWVSVHLTALGINGIVWYLGLRQCPSPLAAIGLTSLRLPARRTIVLTAVVLATSLIATSVYFILVERLGIELLIPADIDPDIAFDGIAVLLTFQALALVTPISEEIFFRGFIFGGLLPRIGPRRAILISALIFAGFHLSLGAIIPIFITGVLLAWLYWRTGSLWVCIAAHAGQNALAVGFGVLGG